MPTRAELIATGRDNNQIAKEIGADAVIYLELDKLLQAMRDASLGRIQEFEASCFNGEYITGDIDETYLLQIEARQDEPVNEPLDMNIGIAEQTLV
jgi:amidophosphoribosyltransferase